jgi:hypothetical protein
MAQITVPDFDIAAFYYAEIYQALLAYLRINASELTSESDYESHIQLAKAFALVGHLNNTRVDIVGNELLLDSIRLRESLQRLFELIGYELASATPAEAPMLIRLSTAPTTDLAEYLPVNTLWGTEQEDGDEIQYENTSAYPLDRADQVTSVFISGVTQGGVDGIVDTSFPTRFSSVTATFTSADVGRPLLVTNSENGNGGKYTIISIVDANTVEVSNASFATESALAWGVISYSADRATEANDDILTFPIWTSDLSGENALYISHNHLQWNQLQVTVSVVGADSVGVWEYFDDTYTREFPNSVTDQSTTIKLVVNSLLTPDVFVSWPDRRDAVIKVTYNPTGKSEQMASLYNGTDGNYVVTKGLLGQTTIDTDARNYTIESDWNPVPDLTDTTSELSADGDVTFVLPNNTTRAWAKTTINSVEGYWLRYRAVPSGATTYPTVNRIRIDQGDLFFPFNVVQGQTILNEIIGSSNGQAGQEFITLNRPVFDDPDGYGMEIDETGGGTWTPYVEKETLLTSSSTDRHYVAISDRDDRKAFGFGNNINGKAPPVGTNNVRSTYRIGGDSDGNVGANQITGNVTGIRFVAAVGNPRPATGWTIKEGGDETSLERAKDSGPASIRNQSKAVTPSDIPLVAVNEYRTPDGSAPVARAFAIEEASGPKTVGLVVVGSGGGFLTSEQLDDLDEWYNGNRYSVPPIEGVLLLNSEVTSGNYDPKAVDTEYLVIVKGVAPEQIENALAAFLDPLAVKEDGTFIHQFGGLVSTTFMDCAVKDVSTAITNVHRISPASDVTLGEKQLPIAGNIVVNVQEVE